jgi:hypothetical protein
MATRPHLWRVGTDPELHDKYLIWVQQRNQAQYRSEGWQLPFETWCALWQDHWHLRGRARGCYCMTRISTEGAWEVDNVVVVTREEHARRQSMAQRSGYRSPAQTRRRERLGLTT